MRALRFSSSIYDLAAVEEAISTFEPHARIERAQDGDTLVVHVSADAPARERKVAGELSNYALGLTVRARGDA